jgi:hypothetical protein
LALHVFARIALSWSLLSRSYPATPAGARSCTPAAPRRQVAIG